MGTYTATRKYASNHNGRHFAFSEGDKTEVDDDVAAWVNRDSPGTLKPVGAKASSSSGSGGGSTPPPPADNPLACGADGCDFVGKSAKSLAAHQRAKGHKPEGS